MSLIPVGIIGNNKSVIIDGGETYVYFKDWKEVEREYPTINFKKIYLEMFKDALIKSLKDNSHGS